MEVNRQKSVVNVHASEARAIQGFPLVTVEGPCE
jgi:hypothetical protein